MIGNILTYDEACSVRNSKFHVVNGRTKINENIVMPQEGFQETVLSSPADIKIIGGNRGGGKMQPYDSKIVTPFGETTMGDLKVGSIISNPNGQSQRVIQIFEHGEQDVYKFKFIDGAECESGLDHLWLVRISNNTLKMRFDSFTDEIPFVGKIMTTRQIIDFLDKKESASNEQSIKHKNILVPLSKPIQYTRSFKNKSSLHPYLIGVLIGDGCIVKKHINITTIDKEIPDRLNELGYKCELKKKTVTFSTETKKHIKDELNKMGLLDKRSHDKFIPDFLKYATIENRVSLMQGLIDTDGYVDDRGHISYTTISYNLAKDIQYVARSLGGKATITEKNTTFKHKGELRNGQKAYNVWINTKINAELCYLPRKKSRSKADFNGGVSEVSRRIISYEYIGKKNCRCIVVDNPNRLYITNDFIVTHNSGCLLMEVLYDHDNPRFSGIIFRREKDDLKRGLWKDSETFYTGLGDKKDSYISWTFNSQAEVKFEHISDEGKADQRFRGGAVPYFGIDEINQFTEETFWLLLTSNRNAHGIKNRIVGTCNPDIDSWVYKMIRYYINDDGTVNKERDGKIRYFFKYGKTLEEIIWGSSKEEVYNKARSYIDKFYNEEHTELVSKYDLIKSFQFIQGDVYQNKILLMKDPSYIGNIANNGEEAVNRELLGIWRKFDSDDEMISADLMKRMFDNPPQLARGGSRWLTIDVAMEGGDNFIIWVWDGWHIFDVVVLSNVTGLDIINQIRQVAQRYKIPNHRIIYDAIGMGAFLGSKYSNRGFIPNSIPYTSNSAPKDKDTFYDLGAEITNEFTLMIIDGIISISDDLLDRVIPSGKERKTVREHLLHQRKAMRWIKEGGMVKGKHRLIPKKEMRKIIGCSPDFMDSLKMRVYANYRKASNNTIRYIY